MLMAALYGKRSAIPAPHQIEYLAPRVPLSCPPSRHPHATVLEIAANAETSAVVAREPTSSEKQIVQRDRDRVLRLRRRHQAGCPDLEDLRIRVVVPVLEPTDETLPDLV